MPAPVGYLPAGVFFGPLASSGAGGGRWRHGPQRGLRKWARTPL